MRSFNDPTNPGVRNDVRPWYPPTLVVGMSSVPDEALAEQILAIFNPTDAPTAVNSSRANGRCAQTSVQAWVPFDLITSPENNSAFEGAVAKEGPEAQDSTPEPVDMAAVQAQVNALLAEAQAQAEALLREAYEQAEQLRQQAYAQGRAEAEAELRGLIETANSIVEDAQSWYEAFLAQSEPLVLEMVAEIARALFSEGFALDSETLQQTYARVLEHTRALGDLRIYVNPEDARLLDPYWKEAQAALRDQRIRLIPSDSIRRGGCYVEGQYGTVDGRIEVRLERLLTSLIQETQPEGESA